MSLLSCSKSLTGENPLESNTFPKGGFPEWVHVLLGRKVTPLGGAMLAVVYSILWYRPGRESGTSYAGIATLAEAPSWVDKSTHRWGLKYVRNGHKYKRKDQRWQGKGM
jgi:hypothetical protein